MESAVFSFFDPYPKLQNNLRGLDARPCNEPEMHTLAEAMATIAGTYHLKLKTCAEQIDLKKYGIEHNRCIDPDLIGKLTGCKIQAKKDGNQRAECGCVESVDIGQYNTCNNGCRYCYANFNPKSVETFSRQHNPHSPLLIGELDSTDKVTLRKMKSFKEHTAEEQMSLF